MSKGKHFPDKKKEKITNLEERIELKRKKKKAKKRRKEKLRKIFLKVFLILFLVSIIYLGITFWDSKKEQKETDELLNTIEISNEIKDNEKEEYTSEIVQKVRGLKKQYPEVVGWLEIDGTNINYPIMQGEDNEFYMEHNYKKEKSIRGSLFLDKDYDWSIPSSNLLIYGHNNTKDGSMFADLLKYKKKSFYVEHPTIKFTTDTKESEYEIIAVFLSRVYYKSEKDVFRYYYFINAEDENEYDEYVRNAKEESLYNTGKTAKYGDQLITLSTCEYSQEDGRFVVVAREK